MTSAVQRAPLFHRARWVRFAAVTGPGIVVMLADTDAGSVITAAHNGVTSSCCCN